MKILHLSYSNAAGVPHAYRTALDFIGVEAKSQSEVRSPFHCDEVNPDLRANLDWADAIVAYDAWQIVDAARSANKPWLFFALGTHAMRHWDRIQNMAGQSTQFRGTMADQLEFVRFGAMWMPKPVWPNEFGAYVKRKHERFTVCHSPSTAAIKGAQTVHAACDVAGLQLDLVTNVSHEQALARKARCHVLVDMVGGGRLPKARLDGFAVNGIEAMAMGIPVLGQVSPENEPAHRDMFGNVRPYIPVDPDNLADELMALHADPGMMADYSQRGRQFCKTFCDPTDRANQMLRLLS